MSHAVLQRSLEPGARHLSPFLVLGDPTPEISIELARTAVTAGATMLELGFPYDAPCADGPAIQHAITRARAAGTSTAQALGLLAQVRAACPDTPLNLLIYGNLVHARGAGAFCGAVTEAGASSLLVPDVSLEECAPIRAACAAASLGHVMLVSPGTPAERLARIEEACTAFLYLTAYQGVTGAGDASAGREQLARVVERTRRPVGIGFGLRSPDDVERTLATGARIAIVGSHLARLIGERWDDRAGDGSELLAAYGAEVGRLAAACTPA